MDAPGPARGARRFLLSVGPNRADLFQHALEDVGDSGPAVAALHEVSCGAPEATAEFRVLQETHGLAGKRCGVVGEQGDGRPREVRALSDGGGEFFAARIPVVSRDLVLRFYGKISRGLADGMRAEIRLLNGMPAIVAEVRRTGPGFPTFLVTRAEIDAEGKIRELHSVLATRKLTAVRRPG